MIKAKVGDRIDGWLKRGLPFLFARPVNPNVLTVVGTCDPETYPLQKKRHSFEFLRGIAHLRPRTNSLGAVARVRNALAFATHTFFQEQLIG